MKNEELHAALQALVREEKKLVAQVIEHIAEVDRRRLYLAMGFTSLFQYLVDLGYSPASAQRRIDAARLQNKIPTVAKDLESGRLNLSQVSIVAQAIKRKSAETSARSCAGASISESNIEKLLREVRGQDMRATEVKVNQLLDLPPAVYDKKRFQKDESIRVEMTLSRDQWEMLEKVKQLMSHYEPNPSMATLFEKLATEFLRRKDPGARKEGVKANELNGKSRNVKGHIGIKTKREVFQRDQSCQWTQAGIRCGSKFQLQLDHKHPRWAGGENSPENLQLLCAAHNRLKYQRERARWDMAGN